MRGLSASGASRTLVLAGGVPLNDPFGGWVYWGRVPQAAIERIEVVRGGLSDLYGADAAGGVIHIVPFGTSRSAARGRWKAARSTSRVSLLRIRRIASALASRSPPSGCRPKARRSSTKRCAGRSTRPPASARDVARVGGLARQPAVRASRRVSGFSEDARTARRCRTTTRTSGRPPSADPAASRGGAWQAQAFAPRRATISRSAPSTPTRTAESLTTPARAGRHARRQRRMVAHLFARGPARRRGTTAGRRRHHRNALRRGMRSRRHRGGRQRSSRRLHAADLRRHAAVTVVGGVRVDHWREQRRSAATIAIACTPSAPRRRHRAATDAGSLRGTVYRAFRTPTLNELHRNFRVGDAQTLANEGLEAETLTGGEVSWLWGQSPVTRRATAFFTSLDDAVANVTLPSRRR